MEPDGMRKAWTTKVRIKRARITAMTMASIFSRRRPLVRSSLLGVSGITSASEFDFKVFSVSRYESEQSANKLKYIIGLSL